jgi:uncharacterized protein YlxP (DUF503 family)
MTNQDLEGEFQISVEGIGGKESDQKGEMGMGQISSSRPYLTG